MFLWIVFLYRKIFVLLFSLKSPNSFWWNSCLGRFLIFRTTFSNDGALNLHVSWQCHDNRKLHKSWTSKDLTPYLEYYKNSDNFISYNILVRFILSYHCALGYNSFFALEDDKFLDIAIIMIEKRVTCSFPVYQRINSAGILLVQQPKKASIF